VVTYSRAELEAFDDAYLWHPFTPQSVYREEEPLLIERGEGHYLIDVDGRRYLDGVASLWCNLFGHRKREIDDAIRGQLDKIAHATLLGHASVPAVLLAKRLADLAPRGLDKVFFSDDGSTAVEVAIKMALQFWQQTGAPSRKRFLALGNAYSGDTVGAVSIGGIDLFHQRFGALLFDVLRAPAPNAPDALAGFERAFDASKRELAAVVIEPGFQGAGGIVTYPSGYLQRVAELCRKADVLLIFDEVASGMGRSGRLFAAEREGVTPDLLCIAKGLTGGYLPLAATLATRRLFDAFLGPPAAGRTFFHGHTYTGNALGAAAALATLDLFEKERIIERMPSKIARLELELSRLRGLPGVTEIRQYGLAAGIPLGPFEPSRRVGYRVCRRARDRGVFLRPLGDTLVIMPPLSIKEEEIGMIVGAIEHGIKEELRDAS
jgi:adenosylmethionine-8-amino-7-oxononanoate aminotransferase